MEKEFLNFEQYSQRKLPKHTDFRYKVKRVRNSNSIRVLVNIAYQSHMLLTGQFHQHTLVC